MADELFALKTNFYIGAHQAVISEALTVSPSTDAVRIERDFFMYRAYVEQAQYHLVKDEVGADAPASRSSAVTPPARPRAPPPRATCSPITRA